MSTRKKIALWMLAVLVLVIVGVAITGTVVYRRAVATPDYWQVVDLSHTDVAPEAAAFEQWATSTATKHRAYGEPWQVEIAAEDMNRWLAMRLPGWAANQGFELPDWLEHPMVAFADGRVYVAGRINHDDQQHVVSMAYEPTGTAGDQPVIMELVGVYVGKLRVAESFGELADLIDTLVGLSEFDRQQVADLRGRLQRIALANDLGDGRAVEVIGIEVGDDTLTLTCRTVRER